MDRVLSRKLNFARLVTFSHSAPNFLSRSRFRGLPYEED